MRRLLVALALVTLIPVSSNAQEVFRDSVACTGPRAAFVVAAADAFARLGLQVTFASESIGTITATKTFKNGLFNFTVSASTDGRTMRILATVIRTTDGTMVDFDGPNVATSAVDPVAKALRALCNTPIGVGP